MSGAEQTPNNQSKFFFVFGRTPKSNLRISLIVAIAIAANIPLVVISLSSLPRGLLLLIAIMVRTDGRFAVTYLLANCASLEDAQRRAKDIALEQTVELPAALVEDTWCGANVVGKVEGVKPKSDGLFLANISYDDDTAGDELTQLINVIFGNTSIYPGVQVTDVELSSRLHSLYPGPKFGIDGLRELCGAPNNAPLVMTALKPMGTSAADLAHMAYRLAVGGCDIIKDDHGLANQKYAPYEERVKLCSAAVARANAETGKKCIYAPCVNAPAHLVHSRAMFAKQQGAGALLVLPGICGFDAMRALAADSSLNLPILCHPAMLGLGLGGSSTPGCVHGFSHEVLFGILPRLCGADACIFPNYGGRFGFTKDECQAICDACWSTSRLAPTTKPCLPSPGGGMTLERIGEMREVFGNDLLLLIGGSLLGHDRDDVANGARYFMKCAGRGDDDQREQTGKEKATAPAPDDGDGNPRPAKAARPTRFTPLEGNHGKLFTCTDLTPTAGGELPTESRWMCGKEPVPTSAYKQDAKQTWSKINRTELIGMRGESTHFHVRYFEIAPGGHSTFEHHVHEHVVIPLSGKGEAQVLGRMWDMKVGDVCYVAPREIHQFRNPAENTESFGFLCIVNSNRDRPVTVDPNTKTVCG